MTPHLPTAEEINVHDSLDEQSALKHFHGKTLEQAESFFRENFLYYQEDLMWMGPKAFCFYVHAAINYLRSRHADGDSDAASSFCGLIEFWLEDDGEAIAPARPAIWDAIHAILADFDRYDCDVESYGTVAARYQALLEKLTD